MHPSSMVYKRVDNMSLINAGNSTGRLVLGYINLDNRLVVDLDKVAITDVWGYSMNMSDDVIKFIISAADNGDRLRALEIRESDYSLRGQ